MKATRNLQILKGFNALLPIAVLWLFIIFPEEMENVKIFGIETGIWAIGIALFSLAISLFTFLRSVFKDRKDNNPKVDITIGLDERKEWVIIAHYLDGLLPVTFKRAILLYKNKGLHPLPEVSYNLKSISRSDHEIIYRIKESPVPNDQIVSVALIDLLNKVYYGRGFPKSHKATFFKMIPFRAKQIGKRILPW